jgi:hypothetical protein
MSYRPTSPPDELRWARKKSHSGFGSTPGSGMLAPILATKIIARLKNIFFLSSGIFTQFMNADNM